MLQARIVAFALAVSLAGCAHGGRSTAAATASAAAVAAGSGDAGHGRSVYGENCAACHGVTGVEGGIGPSLRAEKARKNAAAVAAWVKDPQPPMPKLFPSPLGEHDVADVAAYVESL